MPLEGIRAWIGEVERKLGMRTRVFLVLAAIAIGGAGAAIYLAIDTRDNAVSEGDVRALQRDLEAQIAGGGSPTGTSLAQLEADLRALEAKVGEMRGGGGAASSGGAGVDSGGAASDSSSSSATGEPPGNAKLRDFLGEAAKQGEAAEGDGAGG